MPILNIEVEQDAWDQINLWPAAQYTGTYAKPETKNSKSSGKPVLSARIVVESPERVNIDGKDVLAKGKAIFDTISLDPNAPFTLRARLAQLGIAFEEKRIGKKTSITFLSPLEESFEGKRVVVTVSQRTNANTGALVNNIDRVALAS